MDHRKHYRHELKYVIPFADYVAMRARLRPVMKIDPHADTGGRYRIRSQIDSLVETDPSAFYSYEEYEFSLPEGFNMDDLPEGFDAENLPEGFDPNNMPNMGGSFNPGNMPDMGGSFSPGNMPDMGGSFNPDNTPNTEDLEPSGSADAAFESQSDPLASFTSLTSVSQKAPSASGSSEGSSVSDGSKTKPESRPSFSGMPGSSSSQTKTKNLVSFGICLAVMIAALILAKCYKRRK